MSTVGDLVDRVQREWLELPDETWVRASLKSAVDAQAVEWQVDLSTLGHEEQALFSPGVVVEVDSEQAAVVGLVDSTLTVRRAIRGTTAAAHGVGAEVLVAPPFSRLSVFDAVADSIVGLHPPLFSARSAEVTAGVSGVTKVPDDVVNVTSVRRLSNNTSVAYEDIGTYQDPDAPQATIRAIRVFSVPPTEPLWLSYRGRFTRPGGEGDGLATLGVRDEWARIVCVGAAAQLIAARPMSEKWQEYVSAQLRSDAYPVETPSRIRDAMLRYHEFLVDKAAASLEREHPADVQVSAL